MEFRSRKTREIRAQGCVSAISPNFRGLGERTGQSAVAFSNAGCV